MPSYPAFLARRFEARGVRCAVDKIDDLSPRFRRVHLRGDGLRGHAWQPCQVTSFRVSPTQFRHYTPDSYDADTGRMSILFYRHCAGAGAGVDTGGGTGVGGDGGGGAGHLTPTERWLAALACDDPVVAIQPGAARTFQAVGDRHGSYLLLGDATTVGLWNSLLAWLPPGAAVAGAVELPAADAELGRELLPGIDVLAGTAEPGAVLTRWLAERRLPRVDHTYLSGHAQTIQRLRTDLRDRHGVPRTAIRTQPYWATGKAGL